MIKIILFDYDGVIVDSFPTIYNVYRVMAKEIGVDFPSSLEEFRRIYGRHCRECYQNLKFPVEKYELANQIFGREVVKQNPKIFTGIKEAVEQLSKKYKLIVVSANYKKEIEQKLKKGNLIKYFSHISGMESSGLRFRKSQAYLDVLKKYKATVDEAVVIGDRDTDIINAQKVGIKNIIIVKYGWGHSGKEKRIHEVNTPQDIVSAVRKIDHEKANY